MILRDFKLSLAHIVKITTIYLFVLVITMTKLTPAQQQYMDMKRQHPDCVLFFRL